jgi:TM2 domain-containing membrane protein YozV
MSDNNQPPVPPQGSPVPPPNEQSSEHAQQQQNAAPMSPPAYDPSGYQESLQQPPSDVNPYETPQQPPYDQGAYQQAPQQPTYDQGAYQQAPQQPTYDQGAYQQAPQQPTYDQGAYQQAPYTQGGYPQQGAGGYPAGPGYAPGGYNVDPLAKSRVVAGILGILLGAFGVHRFYLGYVGIGILMVCLTVLSLGFLSFVPAIWGLVEGILILVRSPSFQNDATGRPLRDG